MPDEFYILAFAQRSSLGFFKGLWRFYYWFSWAANTFNRVSFLWKTIWRNLSDLSFKWAHWLYCFSNKRFPELLTLGVENLQLWPAYSQKWVQWPALCLAALPWEWELKAHTPAHSEHVYASKFATFDREAKWVWNTNCAGEISLGFAQIFSSVDSLLLHHPVAWL